LCSKSKAITELTQGGYSTDSTLGADGTTGRVMLGLNKLAVAAGFGTETNVAPHGAMLLHSPRHYWPLPPPGDPCHDRARRSVNALARVS
jgi:hypothetical protein